MGRSQSADARAPGRTLSPAPPSAAARRLDARSLRLIGITDREVLGMGGQVEAARRALDGGLPALMLREKDLPDDDLLRLGADLRRATQAAGALLIVNRRLQVARAIGADGVHLGAEGPSLAEARAELGEGIVLGYSAHDLNETLTAFGRGADYVIFSPVYETPSKRGILKPVGLEALARVVEDAPGPVIALGGVCAANIAEVAATGASGVAAIRAVFAEADPGEACRVLLERWDAASALNPGSTTA